MTAELGALFPCERFAQDFPRGMPLRTCLRRQLERQASVKRGVHGPPRRPFCAEQCALGRENRARLPGLALSACPTCGAALIGAASCEACEVDRMERGKAPARGFLPASEPGGASSRIWGPDAPDAPIGPPPATSEYSGHRPEKAWTPGSTTDARLSAAAAQRARREAAKAASSDTELHHEGIAAAQSERVAAPAILELIRQHEAALVDLRAELRERRDEIAAALGETTAVTDGPDGAVEAA